MSENLEKAGSKPISDSELQRRWKAVREQMKERSLDFLIFQNSSNILPGNVKWFTDLNFSGMIRPITVVFPRDDEMTLIRRALRPAREEPLTPELRGVKKNIFVPMFWTSLTPAVTRDAEKTVELLSGYKNARIGWVGLGYIPAAFYRYVTDNLPGATFEDATEMIDYLKAIKSDEEINLIRETCALEDRLFEYVLTVVKPGETDADLKKKIIDKCIQWGADYNIDVRTAPAGVAPRFIPGRAPQLLHEGDQIILLLETSSTTGYWGELSRTICIGKIPEKLQMQFDLAIEAQQLSVDMLKPGTPATDFWEANNAFMREKGYPEEIRLFAHGQGYDMVERPCLDPDEFWEIKARMFLAVHPEVKSNEAFGWVCDNFLVNKDGKPERLQTTPQKIFTI